MTLSGASIPGLSEPGSDGNEGVLHSRLSLSIPAALTIRLFSVISGHSLGESYSSLEMLSVYFTALNKLGWMT